MLSNLEFCFAHDRVHQFLERRTLVNACVLQDRLKLGQNLSVTILHKYQLTSALHSSDESERRDSGLGW